MNRVKKPGFYSIMVVCGPFQPGLIPIFNSVVGYQPFINPTHGLATQILTTGLFISVDNPMG
jgi:hypothetical protein